MTEQVLVVPQAEVDRMSAGRGFVVGDRLSGALASARFMDRDYAERDERFRQVIPYVLLRRGDSYFSYARTRRGREQRLHGQRSIGIGGHINPSDLPDGLGLDPRAALDSAARRELAEEVVDAGEPSLEVLGFVDERDTPVGRVHLGLVLRAEVTASEPRLSDEGKLTDGRLIRLDDLVSDLRSYEGWSQHVLNHLASTSLE